MSIGYDFTSSYTHDLADNWSLPAVGRVEFSPVGTPCNYPENYPGFDYFGYEFRTIKNEKLEFFYKIWKNQHICLYPLDSPSGTLYTASQRIVKSGGACPSTHPLDCGVSGCYDSSECPITRIEFKPFPSAQAIDDPKTQFCYNGAGDVTCNKIIVTRSKTAFPLVEITSNAQKATRPLMCRDSYAREPHNGIDSCNAASSTFFRFDQAIDSNEITLLAENGYQLLITNDEVFTRARPAIYYRNSLRFDNEKCDFAKIDKFIASTNGIDSKVDSAEVLAIVALAILGGLCAYVLICLTLNLDQRKEGNTGFNILGFGLINLITIILFIATACVMFALCGVSANLMNIMKPVIGCIIGETKDNFNGPLNNASARFALSLVGGLLILAGCGAYIYSCTLPVPKKNLPAGEEEEIPEAAPHPFEIRQIEDDE